MKSDNWLLFFSFRFSNPDECIDPIPESEKFSPVMFIEEQVRSFKGSSLQLKVVLVKSSICTTI
jgi:hypothetical protein